MEVQPQLVLLQKTLLNIEGLGRQLYPDLDLWKTAKPILEHWMKERMSLSTALTTIQKEEPNWLHTLPTLPRLLHDLGLKAQEGKLTTQLSPRDLAEIKQEIRHSNRRTLKAITGATFIIGAAVTTLLSEHATEPLGISLLSAGLGLWGALLLFSSFQKR